MIRHLLLFMGLLTIGCSGSQPVNSTPPTIEIPTPREPVAIGSQFPKLEAPVWTKGEPPAFGSKDVKGYIVDLWGAWCPLCREAAPGLAKLALEYQPRGVVFVSMSNHEPVEGFLVDHELNWHSGWKLSNRAIGELGAFNNGMADHNTGYSVKPLTYLLDPTGKVLWHDQAARWRHKRAKDWQPELKEQLEKLVSQKP